MSRAQTVAALTRIAWAYALIHLNFNLGTLDVLPDWLGYLLILHAIPLLPQRRDLALLRPFCLVLAIWSGAQWAWTLFGGSFRLYPLDLIVTLVSLYFHFQLLTDLAGLAMLEPETVDLTPALLRVRTARTVVYTLLYLLAGPYFIQELPPVIWGVGMVSVVLAVVVIVRVFSLRNRLRGIDREEAE